MRLADIIRNTMIQRWLNPALLAPGNRRRERHDQTGRLLTLSRELI